MSVSPSNKRGIRHNNFPLYCQSTFWGRSNLDQGASNGRSPCVVPRSKQNRRESGTTPDVFGWSATLWCRSGATPPDIKPICPLDINRQTAGRPMSERMSEDMSERISARTSENECQKECQKSIGACHNKATAVSSLCRFKGPTFAPVLGT